MEITVKMTEITDAMPALCAVMKLRLKSWSKTRELSRYYEELEKEARAYIMALRDLDSEYTDKSGADYVNRRDVLSDAEMTVTPPVLSCDDFDGGIPTAAEMYLLRNIITFTGDGRS